MTIASKETLSSSELELGDAGPTTDFQTEPDTPLVRWIVKVYGTRQKNYDSILTMSWIIPSALFNVFSAWRIYHRYGSSLQDLRSEASTLDNFVVCFAPLPAIYILIWVSMIAVHLWWANRERGRVMGSF